MENTTVQMVALFLQTSVQMGTPILFATLGAILGEKVGHLNLGVEGMMLMGAVIGFQVGFSSGDPALTLLAAGSAGALGALIYAFVTVTLRANQIVTGLALTIFGTGFSSFVGQKLAAETLSDSLVKSFAPMEIPILKDIPILGKMFFSQSLYVWLAFILAFVVYFFIKCTRYGLNLRVVGENPAAADASGVHVDLYKYISILLGGAMCGIGGAYTSVVFIGRWQEEITAGVGWIAVALVIFATWHPLKAIFGAYFFGMLRTIGFKIQNLSIPFFGSSFIIPTQLLDMIPYLMTIIVLVIITLRKKRENQPPGWLGNPYFREDR
ncbi:MAG: ABC transporter permease [Clostridia bacterium]|nr:ABC transporter permease [Clostridia bacterium]MDD4571620.1 ABC transporter permease [Clostridia bacterium]